MLEELLELGEDELDKAPTPYLVTRRWVREKYSEWGPRHPLWEARVLGQFPVQGDDALISLAWIEAAARREVADGGGKVYAGLDVAGPGDDETVLAIVEGANILELRSWTKSDPRGEVAAALSPWRSRLEKINVDSVGIGYYFAQHLRDLGYEVREVNAAESPGDAGRYRNRKAEFYWGLRMRLEAGDVAGLTDEKTIGQLTGIRYKHNARGQIEIESKEDARKRGVKSPDRAEAVMLAFARPEPVWRVMSVQVGGREDPDKPQDPFMKQLRAGLGSLFQSPDRSYLCSNCAHLVPPVEGETLGRCRVDPRCVVVGDELACPEWDAR